MRGRRPRWRGALLSVLGVAALVTAAIAVAYTRDLHAIRGRVTAGSALLQTSSGMVEYTVWGEGLPVMVVHGSGGGYDQGVLIARAFGGEGFHWISPSRFGYLRSSLPADASTGAQAEVFAELLDALGVERVAILAMSGGVPPALQFAARYPERTTGLVLLSSAPYTPLTAAEQRLPVPLWVYQALFSSDFPYWLLTKVARPSLERLFDVTPALRAELATEEQAMVAGMIDSFQPVTWRSAGVRNEGAAIDPHAHYQLDHITAPALVIHARDDGINAFSYGEYTARHLAGARFVPLSTGGHLLLGHQAEIRAQTRAFLQAPWD